MGLATDLAMMGAEYALGIPPSGGNKKKRDKNKDEAPASQGPATTGPATTGTAGTDTSGGVIGSKKRGGKIRKTGKYMLHRGERVLNKGQQRRAGLLRGRRAKSR